MSSGIRKVSSTRVECLAAEQDSAGFSVTSTRGSSTSPTTTTPTIFGSLRRSVEPGRFLCFQSDSLEARLVLLKGVFAKNERGYRLNAIKKCF